MIYISAKIGPKISSDFHNSSKTNKQIRKKIKHGYLFIEKNLPMLHIHEWQKYVNLYD